VDHYDSREWGARRPCFRSLEVVELKTHRWFLPETPDVLGMLRDQLGVTIEGIDALVRWANGDAAAAEAVREYEHLADERKRALRLALTTAFTTPLGAEDLFTLSGELDEVLNGAKDAVRESEVMALPPDRFVAEMAGCLLEGMQHLAEAFGHLGGERTSATEAADAAVKSARQLERVYRHAMGELLDSDDLREVMGRRELYRRLSRLGDGLVGVAERVWYAVVKEA
jgi:uncharacterized protein Yka (UPF0111/DUF47 family)